MKITHVAAFLLYDRFVFVKVDTDEGITGWGEAAFHGGRLTAQMAKTLGEQVIGKDPFQTDAIWTELFHKGYRIGNTGGYVAAIGALDIALYDIKGRALEELEVFHFEEPIAPWDLEGYNRLQAALQIPLAAGEQECNLWQFRDLITVANMDILQPNLTTCGGYTQGMKIAALAQAYNRPITTHNTEPTLMTAAHVHFWATCQSCIYAQEYFGEDEHPLRDQTPVLRTPIAVVDGAIDVPQGPGLGIEVDEAVVREVGEEIGA